MAVRDDLHSNSRLDPSHSFEVRPAHLPAPTPPERPFERSLIRLWEAELGLAPIGIDDDFFELGGDSVIALNVFLAFEELSGIKIGPSILVERPTIRAIADIARAEVPLDIDNKLVVFNDSGPSVPFYFIPGLGGDALNARYLSQALGDDIRFCGVPNLDDAVALISDPTVENIAAGLVATLRNARPVGPYILGGYCVGGIYAYEAARQLRASGEEVPLLVIIDAVNKSGLGGFARWASRWRAIRMLRAEGADDRLKRLVANKIRSTLFRIPVLGGELRRRYTKRAFVRQFSDPRSRVSKRAYERYRPHPYDGRILLYVSEENRKLLATDELGWGHLAKAGLEIVNLPVNHHEFMARATVEMFAGDLRERILAVRPIG